MADSTIHAYFGGDEGRVREAAQKMAHSLVPEAERAFGLEVIDGTAENSEGAGNICRQAIEAIQTMPFMGGDKTVWLRGGNFFGEEQPGATEAAIEGLEALLLCLEKAPDGVNIVLSGGKISKNRRFYKGLAKLVDIQLFEKPDLGSSDWPIQAAAVAGENAQGRGITFDAAALELFVMLVGEDSAQLLNEMEKLDLYLGDRREVTEDDVREIAADTRGGIIFEIGEAIARKDLAHALSRVEKLIERGENAVGIMRASVIPQVRNMLYAQDLAQRHGIRATGNPGAYTGAVNRLSEAESAHLPRTKAGKINAYGLFMAAKASGGAYNVDQLTDALEHCLEADLALVTSSTPPLTVFTKMLVGIMT